MQRLCICGLIRSNKSHSGHRTILTTSALILAALSIVGQTAQASPTPLGTSATTVSYETAAGMVSATGDRNYSGVGPLDATLMAGADNIKSFNSLNDFGRRPLVPGGIRSNEALITHAFYKNDNDAEYFPGLIQGGNIRIQVENIQFDQPVTVEENTIMLHALFSADQADQLDDFYIHVQNHHTATFPFRDADGFFTAGVFNAIPVETVSYLDINPIITGNGTNTIGIELVFPYTHLRNFEEHGQVVPDGLPAPQGFLEPFHFHLEYAVSPEPGTLALLIPAIWYLRRRQA